MHKEITHTHTLVYPLFMTGGLSWMWHSEDPWEEARPLSLLPLTLQGRERPSRVCISQDNPDWKAVRRQACSVKGGRPFLCLPVAVWQRRGRSALKECLFTAITVAGTVMGPFDSTIPTLSIPLFLCLYWCAPGTLSWYPTHTVSVLWPHSSDCINSDYGRIILVCLAIKYAHVWLSRAASQALIGTSPSPI